NKQVGWFSSSQLHDYFLFEERGELSTSHGEFRGLGGVNKIQPSTGSPARKYLLPPLFLKKTIHSPKSAGFWMTWVAEIWPSAWRALTCSRFITGFPEKQMPLKPRV
ncbi:hypothetical protein, partial [Pseudomonas sp. PA-4-8C]|uniref:hypothetical protein n=1 Tax=Pseudomonas sp. PA-4-8C TaxID=2665476 RepID=UPI001F3CD850